MEDFEQIIYEVVNNTAMITLNRPEKLNALTLQLQSELSEALWAVSYTHLTLPTKRIV